MAGGVPPAWPRPTARREAGAHGAGRRCPMILIRFEDLESKRRALGYLAGRFSFKSWTTGEMLVPEPALAEMAMEGIKFTVEGPATHEQSIPAVRIPPGSLSNDVHRPIGAWSRSV